MERGTMCTSILYYPRTQQEESGKKEIREKKFKRLTLSEKDATGLQMITAGRHAMSAVLHGKSCDWLVQCQLTSDLRPVPSSFNNIKNIQETRTKGFACREYRQETTAKGKTSLMCL